MFRFKNIDKTNWKNKMAKCHEIIQTIRTERKVHGEWECNSTTNFIFGTCWYVIRSTDPADGKQMEEEYRIEILRWDDFLWGIGIEEYVEGSSIDEVSKGILELREYLKKLNF
jgi:hypothetical protein